MGSHSVTCHPAEVTFPPSAQPKLVLDLATPEGCKAELASKGVAAWAGPVAGPWGRGRGDGGDRNHSAVTTVHGVFTFCVAYEVAACGRLGVAACVAVAAVDRQARQSCLVWRELTAGQVRSAWQCVQRSHCAARHTPTQTRHRTHLSGGLAESVHTATSDATRRSCLCHVCVESCDVNWTIALNVFRLQTFCRRQS